MKYHVYDILHESLIRHAFSGVDRNHPLNAQLSLELGSVERSLTSLAAPLNTSLLGGEADNSFVVGAEPISPIGDGGSIAAHELSNGHNASHDITNTPRRDYRATPSFRRLVSWVMMARVLAIVAAMDTRWTIFSIHSTACNQLLSLVHSDFFCNYSENVDS